MLLPVTIQLLRSRKAWLGCTRSFEWAFTQQTPDRRRETLAVYPILSTHVELSCSQTPLAL